MAKLTAKNLVIFDNQICLLQDTTQVNEKQRMKLKRVTWTGEGRQENFVKSKKQK